MPAYEINDYYGDKKRAAEARKLSEAVQQLEDASAEASPAPTPTKGKGRRRQEKAYYCVTVTDNGSGMPHRELPQMFGKGGARAPDSAPAACCAQQSPVPLNTPSPLTPTPGPPTNLPSHATVPVLSGTKYKLKQSRGRFGLGAKMALLHSKMTTARPLEVFSAQEGKDFISRYATAWGSWQKRDHFLFRAGPGARRRHPLTPGTSSRAVLDINMEHNEPIVLKHEKLRNDGSDDRFPENWRGSRVQVTIEGNYSAGQGQAYRVRPNPLARCYRVVPWFSPAPSCSTVANHPVHATACHHHPVRHTVLSIRGTRGRGRQEHQAEIPAANRPHASWVHYRIAFIPRSAPRWSPVGTATL